MRIFIILSLWVIFVLKVHVEQKVFKSNFYFGLPCACFSLSRFSLATIESVSAVSAIVSSFLESGIEDDASPITSLSSNLVEIGMSSLISYLIYQ